MKKRPFLDAHIHLWEFCLFNYFTNLAGVSSKEELIAALKARPLEGWYVGVRFNQESLKEKALPERSFLDRAFGKAPALIFRTCLHLAIANTAAMEALERPAPEGIFREADVFAILNELPERLKLDPELIVKEGVAGLESLGVTRTIDMGMDLSKRKFFGKIDYYTTDFRLLGEALGFKLFLDGSLGARTAALSEEYSDDPGNCGVLNYSDAELLEIVERVHQAGKPVACHAIGDRAVDQFLGVIGKSRHPQDRLEHAQYLRHDQIDALAELGVAVCIQPIFSREVPWARKRLGPRRMETAYAWGLLLKQGVRLLAGSDAPVDAASPLEAANAVASLKGAQRLSRAQVLDLFGRANWEFYGWEPGAPEEKRSEPAGSLKQACPVEVKPQRPKHDQQEDRRPGSP
ncbi:MAG: amidohydrolase family protein [Firmicutes bacterium]|nr:amidohydrolase family protein [Bacillota bacterium]